MTENQFWWANLHNHDHIEVVEVRFEDGKPHWVYVTGTDIGIAADEFDRCQMRLIERVLPAGRAAAVEKLEGERDLARASPQKLHVRCRQAEAHIADLEREAELDRQTIDILRGRRNQA